MAKIGYSLLSIALSLVGISTIWLVWVSGSYKYRELASIWVEVGIGNLIAISIASFASSLFFIIINLKNKSWHRISAQIIFGACVIPLFLFVILLGAHFVHRIT